MVATTNHKYANSSLNYHVIMMVQNLKKKKNQNREFPNFSHFRQSCRGNGNTHGDSHSHGMGMGMGKIFSLWGSP